MLIFKNNFIKIRKSLGRFFSLIFIVLLGSAFFSGLHETSSDMIKTMDNYYDRTSLMDFKIVSTMGLTKEDVSSLKKLDNAIKVVPAYSYETIIGGNTTKILSLSDEVNKVKLISGRMPKEENEILVEENTYSLGDTITFADDSKKYLKNTTYNVVGTIRSPLYIYENKGISNVGDGKLDTFMYVLSTNFVMDYYTEIYLIASDSTSEISYLDDYKSKVEKLENELKKLKSIRETARYEQLLEEAMKKIYDAEDELNKNKRENDEKFSKALTELNNSEVKLSSARKEYQEGLSTLERTKLEMEAKFAEETVKINEGNEKIDSALDNYGITKSQIDDTLENLYRQILQLKDSLELLNPTSEEYQTYQNNLTALEASHAGLQKIKTTITELEDGREKIKNGESTWNLEYNKSLSTLNSSYQQILDGEASLKQGREEYEKNYQTYQEKIAKAEKEIEDAKIEVTNLEKPVWYLLDRNDNSGYAAFYECATKVDSIATVFPAFFILIAILMCMNTMTRMIDEERSEIGLFISLGFSKGKIILSYIFYVLIASLVGLSIGLSIGYFIVPLALYDVYTASFVIPPLTTYFNFISSIIIILVGLGFMTAATWLTASRNFKYMPASLLRPEVPKKGTKVFLEHINFIWNHLSFSWKVTVRNLFRYKKRIIMTLIGISGCTALLLTGFGLKDSVGSLLDEQFGKIQTYDMIAILNNPLEEEFTNIHKLLSENNIQNEIYVNMENYTFRSENKNLDVYVMAFQDTSNINLYLDLKAKDDSSLSLDDYGVIVTEKMAELLNLKIGDTFQIRNSDNELFVLKVSGIAKNYVSNYIYMNDVYYNKIFNRSTYNSIMLNTSDKSTANIGNNFINSNYFSSIQYTSDNMSFFKDVINGMNDIVYLIIGFSTFLAITVLYNLTTINISERKREIASLKVLGFHDNEVSSYVYRETIVLTIFGVLLGIAFGVILNSFVLTIAETDEIMFIKNIYFSSYLYTFTIMILFTLIVQLITYFILKRIDMIDSLKSVE